MIHAEDLLQLVGELAAQVGPDTEFRWKRDLDWHPDDEANFALQRLFKAWRTYQATPKTATLSVAPALQARLAALAAAENRSITSLLEWLVLEHDKRTRAKEPVKP
ncbi:MAG: hypothetical protein V9G18_12675 [Albidovulum sp.]